MNLAPISPADDEAIEAVRHFDRFYAERLRIMRSAAALHESTWNEMRVFRALGTIGEPWPAASLARNLRMDASYLSRILNGLVARELLCVGTDLVDRRRREYSLTAWGRKAYREMETFHRDEVRRLLDPLPPRHRRRLLLAMRVIEEIHRRDAWDETLDLLSPATRRRLRRSALRRGVL
jgi:DNA-binding MarR family transcriptional regulator